MKIYGTSKTKESKYNSTVALIGSIGMLVFVFMAFDFSGMPTFAKFFMVLWVFLAFAQIYQFYRNSIFSKKSLHHEVTDHDMKISGVTNTTSSTKPEQSHAMRLRQIEQLYRDGLLTSEEYEAKRQDVLDEDWGK